MNESNSERRTLCCCGECDRGSVGRQGFVCHLLARRRFCNTSDSCAKMSCRLSLSRISYGGKAPAASLDQTKRLCRSHLLDPCLSADRPTLGAFQ